MSQQLWRLDEQTKKAVLQHKRNNRYIAELKQDLEDYNAIIECPCADGGQRSWAHQMIKSIEHELAEIEAGRLDAPEWWKG